MVPVSVAWLTKLLVDEIASGASGTQWVMPAVGLATVSALAVGLTHLVNYWDTELDRRVLYVTTDRLYSAINGFGGLARFENPGMLDRLRLAEEGAVGSVAAAVQVSFSLARSLLTLGSLMLALASISRLMAGLVIAAAVPALLVELALSRQRDALTVRFAPSARLRALYGSLMKSAGAASEIRLLGLGSFLKGRMMTEVARLQDSERRHGRRVVAVQSSLTLAGALIAGGGLVWSAGQAARGRISIGDVTAFTAAVTGAQAASIALVQGIAGLHRCLLMFSHYRTVLAMEPDLVEPTEPLRQPTGPPGIVFRQVWFRYAEEQPWVLRGVDLVIPAGCAVGLVGLNGAGKSTLVKLLCRFYDPDRGAILWDGVDLRDIPLHELRSRLGVLFQEFVRYELTAAENIGVGDLQAIGDAPRIRAVAELAGVHSVLENLPKGYRTLLSRSFFGDEGEVGALLSGGQWQRVGLARALMRSDRRLLILDEPSSGLDAEAEAEIHQQLRAHRRSRTSVLISHRLSGIRDADLIVVLENGRVRQQGTHQELIRGAGPYARLFALQAKGYQATPGTDNHAEDTVDGEEADSPGVETARVVADDHH
ncbi:ABC transporter ATP-binding protein [Kribbella sp. NPDC023855]|uniref:ABC transporter ATP-binding protein n=1 Tax=Kribbella sp. NPDC023855 TaxID=3154698 RepID=UPI00340BFB2C